MSQVAFYDRLVMSQKYDKASLKLDLHDNRPTKKRIRAINNLAVPSTALLQSPDLQLLKLASPELEKLIIQHNGFIPTPTPGGNSSLLQTGDNLNEDKESFARGFIEALQRLQEQDEPEPKTWNIPQIVTGSGTSSTDSLIKSSGTSPKKWIDHNRNSVSVITPTRYDAPSPPMMHQPTTNNVLANFPTVSTGAVSTMGMTAIPRASSSYTTRPQQDRMAHQSVSHSFTTSGMTLPTSVGGIVSSSSMMDQVYIKSEDDAIVPSINSDDSMSLDMNPIDLDAQEQIKHQRKKLRNRLAAQRCRKRKIEREDTLKTKVKDLKNKNSELTTLASTLRMQVCDLKQTVMRHVNEGCQVFLKEDEDKNLLTKST